jgi:hypothetical protein
MPTTRTTSRAQARLQPSLPEIAALVGGDDAMLHTAILATGATYSEIEQAMALAAGADEALGETPHPLEGRVAAVYELLSAEQEPDEA